MAKSRKCQCCGTKYTYCTTCGSDRLKPTWYSQFCSEECMTLWTTAVKFNMKLIDQSEAQAAVKALELKNRFEYVDCIQRDLNNILKEDVVVQEVAIEEEQPIVETVIEEVVVESSIPFIEEITPIPYKKSKKNNTKSCEVVTIEDN